MVQLTSHRVWGGVCVNATLLMVAATAYSALNVWAAVDLGYDRVPGGKEIIARWFYVVAFFLVASIVFGYMTWRAKRHLKGPRL